MNSVSRVFIVVVLAASCAVASPILNYTETDLWWWGCLRRDFYCRKRL